MRKYKVNLGKVFKFRHPIPEINEEYIIHNLDLQFWNAIKQKEITDREYKRLNLIMKKLGKSMANRLRNTELEIQIKNIKKNNDKLTTVSKQSLLA